MTIVDEIKNMCKRLTGEPEKIRSDEAIDLFHRVRTAIENASNGDCKFNCRKKNIDLFNAGWDFGRYTNYTNEQSWEQYHFNKKDMH